MFTYSRSRRLGSRTRAALLAGLLLGLVPLAPARAASLRLDAGAVVLGRTSSVGVTLWVEESAATEGRPLRLSVNVGAFGEVKRLSPGVYRAEYTPPATRFPQVALVAVWHETGPEAPIHFLRLPLYGATRMKVAAPRDAKVKVKVGLDSFGPVTADERGVAEVPLTVPPQVAEAQVEVTDTLGRTTRVKVPVARAPYNRLTLALVPHALATDGQEWARVEVLYDAGRELTAAQLQLTPSAGEVEFVRAERGGKLVYRYRPPPQAPPGEVEFHAQVAGDALSEGRARLTLGRPPAALVQVVTPEGPVALGAGGAPVPVRVRVLDAQGLGVSGARLQVAVDGEPLAGEVRELREAGAGEYALQVPLPARRPGAGALQVLARVERPDGRAVSGEGRVALLGVRTPGAVTARLAESPLLADGVSRTTVTFEVRDTEGALLPGAPLALKGEGVEVGELESLGDGRYRAEVVAPARMPEGGAAEAQLRLADPGGSFTSAFPVPLRTARRLYLGVRAGSVDSLGGGNGLRGGLDVWAPLRLGDSHAALGLTAGYGLGLVERTSPTALRQASGTLLPVSLRLAHAVVTGSSLSVYAGAGALGYWAQVREADGAVRASGFGAGGLGFVAASVSLGPAQLFAEASYTWAPPLRGGPPLEVGGVGAEVGARVALF
jgi:hypothetical protein